MINPLRFFPLRRVDKVFPPTISSNIVDMNRRRSRVTHLLVLSLLSLACAALARPTVPTSVQRAERLTSLDPKIVPTIVFNGAKGVRTILFDDASGDLLALTRGLDSISAIYEDPVGSNTYKSTTIVSAPGLGLNHGLALKDGYIYASTPTQVYRWKYKARTQSSDTTRQVVVDNIEGGGNGGAALGHTTRTILFSPDGAYFYVSIGSLDNVDQTSYRSRVRRFPWGSAPSEDTRSGLPFQFESGEVWADGLRNAVALGFDLRNRLWEADNGPDDLERGDLGAMIYPDNPAEEFNLLDGPANTFYGYPQCFTAGNLTQPFVSDPVRGQQYVWPSFSGQYSDDWCRNTANNRPPLAQIPAHSSPLGLVFYSSDSSVSGCGSGPGAFPCEWAGDAFIALHGSWNSPTIPKGFRVTRIPFGKSAPYYPGNVSDLFVQKNFWTLCANSAALSDGTCFRPSGIAFDKAGTMWVGSGVTGEIARVYYNADGKISVVGETSGVTPGSPGNGAAGTSHISTFWTLFVCVVVILMTR
ncbi:hypothetical protein BJ742DRAFT_790699 [Cladochytrium replicatum]|nr:hypothetical protein BJ742DRAFT_790699 [Cladochytrium replicatum]